MSYIKNITLRCDNWIENHQDGETHCYSEFVSSHGNVKSARQEAREHGWHCEDSWDYCPDCYKERKRK